MKPSFAKGTNKEVFSALSVSFLIPSIMQAAPFPANFELSSLSQLSSSTNTVKIGFVINGEEPGDTLGRSVSEAGDINGDGFGDIIIGAPAADPNGDSSGGMSYVVFGKKGGIDPELELNTLDGNNGFQINGDLAGGFSGFSVSRAGDINGDGLDDLIIGAPYSDPNGLLDAGASYVVFGKTTPFSALLNLNNLDDSYGFQINGEETLDYSGGAVSGAGDINGDGLDDFIIGAPGASINGIYSGSSYVVFGKETSFDDVLELSSLDSNDGFQVNGEQADDYAGFSVNQAGDVNGDGLDDLIIGAFRADSNGTNSGSSYVIFGKEASFDDVLELSTIDGNNGFQISGELADDRLGLSVSQGGDVNGDGFDDLIIGAFGANPNGNNSGSSYVIFGKAAPFDAIMDVNTIDGSNGFQINGEEMGDYSGGSVSQAGDINGDGLDDLIIGAPFADSNGTNSGSSYVIFGRTASFSDVLELSSLNGINGFQISGEQTGDRAGSSVSQAGDINGDGTDDLIIGAPQANPNENLLAGSSYVIYGRDYSPQGDFTANSAPDLLTSRGKALRILPLAISNQVVRAELPTNANLSLPIAITPSADKLPKRVKLLAALDFDDSGVTDFLVQTNKNTLKLFKLVNDGSPVTPTVLSEVNFTVPKKHRYMGAGALTGGRDDNLDLVLKRGKGLFVAENLGVSFSTALKPITGRLSGKVLSIQKGRIITVKGKKLTQQSVSSDLVLGNPVALGALTGGQKPLLTLDINQDGKLDVVTIDKKRSVGFVSEDSLSATPTAIVTLPQQTKVVGPK